MPQTSKPSNSFKYLLIGTAIIGGIIGALIAGPIGALVGASIFGGTIFSVKKYAEYHLSKSNTSKKPTTGAVRSKQSPSISPDATPKVKKDVQKTK